MVSIQLIEKMMKILILKLGYLNKKKINRNTKS